MVYSLSIAYSPLTQNKLWHPVRDESRINSAGFAGWQVPQSPPLHRQPSPARNPKNRQRADRALFQCFFLFTNNRHLGWRNARVIVDVLAQPGFIMAMFDNGIGDGDWCAYR